VRDRQGRDLIDCCAGLWCVNIGYGRKEMAEAASKAIERLAYYHIFAGSSNEPIIRLAERVLGLLHKAGATHLSKVFFGSGGSDANDTNIKLVRYYNNLRGKPEKKKLISRFGAYHGLTATAGSLTGIPAFHKASTCHCRACCTSHARITAEPGARRCRLHGGASTGPRTPEGRRRIGDAQRGSMGTLATGAQRPVNCAAPVLGDAPVR
jgi:adenosylmethionine-8-amino-7-oxononanoate aminotransferase